MAARAIEFRERMSFPVVLEADGKADGKEAHYDPRPLETYFALNEAGFGGWYPIGAAQTWHNGIHLAVPEGTPVRSIARGTIIAARLADPPTEERGRYGTPTFVLIKHTMEILENPKETDHNS